jgi:hypothetical protein
MYVRRRRGGVGKFVCVTSRETSQFVTLRSLTGEHLLVLLEGDSLPHPPSCNALFRHGHNVQPHDAQLPEPGQKTTCNLSCCRRARAQPAKCVDIRRDVLDAVPTSACPMFNGACIKTLSACAHGRLRPAPTRCRRYGGEVCRLSISTATAR